MKKLGVVAVFALVLLHAAAAQPKPGDTSSQSFDLEKGWNTVSVDLSGVSFSQDMQGKCEFTAFEGEYVWRWDAKNREWINPDRLVPGKGYYLKLGEETCSFQLNGEHSIPDSLTLWKNTETGEPGWNMISVPKQVSFGKLKRKCDLRNFEGFRSWSMRGNEWSHPYSSGSSFRSKGVWVRAGNSCVVETVRKTISGVGDSTSFKVNGKKHSLELVSVIDPSTASFRVNSDLKERSVGGSVSLGGEKLLLQDVVQSSSSKSTGVAEFVISSKKIVLENKAEDGTTDTSCTYNGYPRDSYIYESDVGSERSEYREWIKCEQSTDQFQTDTPRGRGTNLLVLFSVVSDGYQEARPRDLDGDGKFEDVNADGMRTDNDADLLSGIDTSSLTTNEFNALDFNGDGALGQEDVTWLRENN